MKILMTGGCGFVGHHFVEHFLKETDAEIVVIDKLAHSGKMERLRDINAFDENRVRVFTHDLAHPIPDNLSVELGTPTYILHIAAESHVDRSITDPVSFAEANVVGTAQLLQWVRTWHHDVPFYYFSTDEVFGSAPQGTTHLEFDPHLPGNPYAASKSGGEMMVHAFANTYRMNCSITRSMNIFGERQHPEKFIPMVIRSVLDEHQIMIHSDPTRIIPGSRFWIHARNVAAAYQHLLGRGIHTGTYHIVGEREIDNLSMAQMIAAIIGKPLHYELVDFHSSRPGHDLRYAMADHNLKATGWSVPVHIETALERTVKWMLDNPRWLRSES